MDFSKIKFNCCDLPSLMLNGRENKPLSDRQKTTLDNIKKKIERGFNLSQTDIYNYDRLINRDNIDEKMVFISKANESFLKKVYSKEKYGKFPINLGKESQINVINGTLSENASLELAKQVLNINPKIHKKVISNRHVKGIIDAYDGKSIKKATHVYEIKTATNYETLLDFLDLDQSKSIYYWQMMGYLSITGAEAGTVLHCCVSYHPDIITQQVNYYLSKIRGLNLPHKEVNKKIHYIRSNMNFDDIPKNERVVKITIERNEDDIKMIKQKIEDCRMWLIEFDKKCSSLNR